MVEHGGPTPNRRVPKELWIIRAVVATTLRWGHCWWLWPWGWIPTVGIVIAHVAEPANIPNINKSQHRIVPDKKPTVKLNKKLRTCKVGWSRQPGAHIAQRPLLRCPAFSHTSTRRERNWREGALRNGMSKGPKPALGRLQPLQ